MLPSRGACGRDHVSRRLRRWWTALFAQYMPLPSICEDAHRSSRCASHASRGLSCRRCATCSPSGVSSTRSARPWCASLARCSAIRPRRSRRARSFEIWPWSLIPAWSATSRLLAPGPAEMPAGPARCDRSGASAAPQRVRRQDPVRRRRLGVGAGGLGRVCSRAPPRDPGRAARSSPSARPAAARAAPAPPRFARRALEIPNAAPTNPSAVNAVQSPARWPSLTALIDDRCARRPKPCSRRAALAARRAAPARPHTRASAGSRSRNRGSPTGRPAPARATPAPRGSPV